MIELRNLTKSYRVKSGRHYVFNGVNAVFPKGANIGIIGPNGGGKSTFLRILGGIDFPDSGRIDSDCTFSWPLGLKGGFVPHLSGRENCRMICNLYGLHLRHTRKQLEKIKELSGIDDYFEEPVKYYSSGMGSRLGFALSMSFDFDYFLIDEITAVGDAQFKELAKQALAEKARTSKVIMVSHSMGDIKKFCDVGVLLKDGQLMVYEDLDDAIRDYLPQTKEANEDLTELLRQADLSELAIDKTSLPAELSEAIPDIVHRLKSVEAKLSTVAHAIRGSEADFYSLLGVVYGQLGNQSQAAHFHRKAIAEDPYTLRSHHQLAHLAFRQDDIAGEETAFLAAQKIDPANIQTKMIRVRICLRQGKTTEALAILEDILKKNPKHAQAWSQRAIVLQRTGHASQALDSQIKALKHAPENSWFLQHLSQGLAGTGAIEPSIKAAYKSAQIPRPSPSNHYKQVLKTLIVLDDRISV